MSKKALVLLAQGFEEVEAVTPIDYLRRAEIEVTIAAIGSERPVVGARGIKVTADTTLAELLGGEGAPEGDALILPGGAAGAANLAASPETAALIRRFVAENRLVAAICAAPAVVLAPLGLLARHRYTCYPGMEANVSPEMNPGARWTADPVVIDEKLITSRGAGTAGTFAAAIIEALLGPEKARWIEEAVVMR